MCFSYYSILNCPSDNKRQLPGIISFKLINKQASKLKNLENSVAKNSFLLSSFQYVVLPLAGLLPESGGVFASSSSII